MLQKEARCLIAGEVLEKVKDYLISLLAKVILTKHFYPKVFVLLKNFWTIVVNQFFILFSKNIDKILRKYLVMPKGTPWKLRMIGLTLSKKLIFELFSFFSLQIITDQC